MDLSKEQFLLLSEEEKYKILKEKNIKIHPYIWILLSDYLKNSITSIYWTITDKIDNDPPKVITYEDGETIIKRCDQLKKAITKMQNELLHKKEDQSHG